MPSSIYEEICQILNLDEQTILDGKKWLRKISDLNLKLEGNTSSKVWITTALFLACIESEIPMMNKDKNKGLTMSQLLSSTKVSLCSFLSHFTQLSHRLLPPKRAIEAAAQLKEDYAMSNILYVKYEVLWSQHGPSLSECSAHDLVRRKNLYRAGWIIFALARHRLRYQFSGLGKLYILLVAVINLVLSNIKVMSVEAEVAATLSALGSSKDGQTFLSELYDSSDGFIEKLCSIPHVDSHKVRDGMLKVLTMLENLVRGKVLSLANGSAPIVTVGTQADIFDDVVLVKNVESLLGFYHAHYNKFVGDFDQTVFLDEELHQSSMPNQNSSTDDIPKEYDLGNDNPKRDQWKNCSNAWDYQGLYPPASPTALCGMDDRISTSPTLHTPINVANETETWLHGKTDAVASAPSRHLDRFFSSCDNHPRAFIMDTLNDISNRISSSNQPGMTLTEPLSEIGKGISKAKALAMCLYFQALERLLIAEEKRLRKSKFDSLLHSNTFHRAFFTCCWEISLKVYGVVSVCFPQILKSCGVDAFDVGKVIESFVKHSEGLPRQLKRHLQDIEERILESYAWTRTSSFYCLLQAANGRENCDELSHPRCDVKAQTTTLHVFYRKVLGLAAKRIFAVCQSLKLTPAYADQVWTVTRECIARYPQILRDRHLDHVLLCSIYGVCKANNMEPEITFKQIVAVYTKLWFQHCHHIIRDIFIDGKHRGDIIEFYNQCYVPVMKSFLLQFQHQENQQAAAEAIDPNDNTFDCYPDNAVLIEAANRATETAISVSGVDKKRKRDDSTIPVVEVQSLPLGNTAPKRVKATNVFVSSRRSAHTSRYQATGRTSALYAFGESPAQV